MAKMKFKFDMAAVKQYLFEKGERVGLIACTVIMVAVVAYSLYTGWSSRSSDVHNEIKKAADRVNQQVQAATLKDGEEKAKVPDAKQFRWVPVPYTGLFLQFFPAPDRGGSKKLNPYILQVMTGDEDKLWQLNYYACGTFVYNIDPASRKATVILGGGGGGGIGEKAGAMIGPTGKTGGVQGGGTISNVAKNVRPTRMVVVSAIFPMRDQLEAYAKDLRYTSVEELLAHRDELPKPIGIEVQRAEMLPGGKWTEWKPLYRIDKNGKAIIVPALKDMMQRMVVDEIEPQLAAQYIFPGLVTPLPQLANAEYAKLDLKGFDVKARTQFVAADGEGPMRGGPAAGVGAQKGPVMPGKGPAMPGKKGAGIEMGGAAGGGGGGDIRLREESWKNLALHLRSKFEEKFSVFDPLAQITLGTPEKKGNVPMNRPAIGAGQDNAGGTGVFGWDLILGGAAAGGGMGPMGVISPMREGDTGDEGAKAGTRSLNVTLNDGALVRFFDPTVEPGKTYCYLVRVRMANPNYQKVDVEYQALALKKELEWNPAPNPLGWVVSPAITIPGDYFFYATDQKPVQRIKGGADSNEAPNANPDSTPIQVHRWLGKVPDPKTGTDWLTADWAIAERLYTRRGEMIGRREVLIEMGHWSLSQQAFELGTSSRAARLAPKGKPIQADSVATAIPVDLTTNPPALLVDFEGGKQTYFTKRDGLKEYVINGPDISAVEALVLMPDGRLIVRNSRVDSDTESPAGKERLDRFEFWSERIAGLRHVRAPGGAGDEAGPAMPKGGNKGPGN